MKAFVATLCLFLLMLGLILFNTLYINRMAFSLCEQLDAIPSIQSEQCALQAEALLAHWKKHSPYVALSVSFPIVDRITEQITLLHTYAKLQDHRNYYATLALLYDSIEDMRRLDTLEIS